MTASLRLRCAGALFGLSLSLIAGCQSQETEAPVSTRVQAPATAMPATETAATEVHATEPVPNTDAEPATESDSSAAAVDATIDEVLGDHATYRKVIDSFKHAVASHDASSAAKLVRFPIDVDVKGRKLTLDDAAAFEKHYEAFMTPAIVKAIVETSYADVLVNAQGVMLGQGEVWISGTCTDNECKAVDVNVITIQPAS
ncbi:hypothetical protein [Dokdonella sp.]|uniref:hypothetical protein n=1 Tax=Dokdonella sp. TaxID=2291710 RepID=UPI003C5F1BA3